MLDLSLRGYKDRILAPPARTLSRFASPMALTVSSAVLCVGAGALAWTGSRWLALAAWLIGRTLDGLDGPVARIRGTDSNFGGYADILGDTIGYAVVPLGVAGGVDVHSTWVALGVLLAVLYVNSISWTFLAAVLEKLGRGADSTGESTTITMPPALIEGTETIVVFSLFLAFPAWATWLFGAMAAMVAFNIVQRLVWARGAL